MDKYYLDQYFASEEYIGFEKNEAYLQLMSRLQDCMREGDFLDVEEELHQVLIGMVEQAFYAGADAVRKNEFYYLQAL